MARDRFHLFHAPEPHEREPSGKPKPTWKPKPVQLEPLQKPTIAPNATWGDEEDDGDDRGGAGAGRSSKGAA